MVRAICVLIATVFFSSAHAKENICVRALLGLDEYRNREAIFYERLLAPLTEVTEILQNTEDARVAAKKLITTDYRGQIFRVEDLLRFYEDEEWAESVIKLYPKIKAMEDALGGAVDAAKLPVKAKELGLPLRTIEYLEKRSQKRFNDLVKLLEQDEWLGDPPPLLKKFIKRVQELEVPSQNENSELTVDIIEKRAAEILDTEFDMSDLQGGVHELRRKLRWFLIHVAAVRGQIQIVNDSSVPAKLKPFQELSEEAKKYLKFPVTTREIKSPIKIKKSKYYALSYFVNAFGDIKDRGELHENLLEALVKSGAYRNKKEADAYLLQILKKSGWTDWHRDAEDLYEKLFESELLEEFP